MMNFINVPIIVAVTFLFAFSFNQRLFEFLDKIGIKAQNTTKKGGLWLIFSTLLSLTGYFYVVHLLLSL